MKNEVFR